MDNIPHSKSVYLFMDRQLPQVTSDTGAKNLLILHGLNHAHYKYCQKKVKDSLTHFLPHLPGIINMGPSDNDSSLRYILPVKFPENQFSVDFKETCNTVTSTQSLRSLIEGQMPQSKPIEPLNSQQMDAFRLSANGAKLPEKLMEELNATARKVKKKKTGRFDSNSLLNKSNICYFCRKIQYSSRTHF